MDASFLQLLGKGSRAAIAAWQSSRTIPATGYLDTQQIEALRQQSAEQYTKWRRDVRRRRLAREKASPLGRWIDRRGCLHERNGRYVKNFKAGCG